MTQADLAKAARKNVGMPQIVDEKAAAMREWDAYVDCKVSQKHGFTGACPHPTSPNPY